MKLHIAEQVDTINSPPLSLGAPRLVYLQVDLVVNSLSFQPVLTNGHARKYGRPVSYDSQSMCICVQALW